MLLPSEKVFFLRSITSTLNFYFTNNIIPNFTNTLNYKYAQLLSFTLYAVAP